MVRKSSLGRCWESRVLLHIELRILIHGVMVGPLALQPWRRAAEEKEVKRICMGLGERWGRDWGETGKLIGGWARVRA
jgi:hypothetical protein